MPVRRLYDRMITVKVLTLGSGAGDENVALQKGPPFPGLRTLVVFDVPKPLMRRIAQTWASVPGPVGRSREVLSY
jgi:hypothetical protein